jgi:subtilisin family serine protease
MTRASLALLVLVHAAIVAAQLRDGSGRYIVRFDDGRRNRTTANALAASVLANLPAGVARLRVLGAQLSPVRTVQAIAVSSWDLDRIDQPTLPLDGKFAPYGTGAGAHVFVVDTGVNLAHAEFAGRIGAGYGFVGEDTLADDCNGHGSHVAGTAAGATYGIASSATVHPVRVLGCTGSGTSDNVIAGIDWVASRPESGKVMTLSLGMNRLDRATDDAVAGAVAAGVIVAIAAGNAPLNACVTSPAATPGAITVGASTSNDAVATYSNFGVCVDLVAPGSAIVSAYTGTSTGAPQARRSPARAWPARTSRAWPRSWWRSSAPRRQHQRASVRRFASSRASARSPTRAACRPTFCCRR